ncbi:MAG: hypothetical protein RIR00_823 [Pseudomonadota bacterium]|jgi:hypothetical protein
MGDSWFEYRDLGLIVPIPYSAAYKSTLAATSAPEAPLMLLEIDHPALSQPVRVVNDNLDIVSNGHTFLACGFRLVLPSDFENQLPKAELAVDNVGRELMQWVETSSGGQGATARMMQIMRSRPDLIELDVTFEMTNVKANAHEVSAELGYENLFSKPVVNLRYDPFTTPGVF